MADFDVSVIIPTFNRRDSLVRTVRAIMNHPCRRSMEIVVVDDGGAYDAACVEGSASVPVRYYTQHHSGPTSARNLGAHYASGAKFVFLDDDIEVFPHAIDAVADALEIAPMTVVVGELLDDCVIAPDGGTAETDQLQAFRRDLEEIHYTDCMTGFLGVTRTDFFALQMFQDPTGGWPNWDDVDFGYRATAGGYRLLKCSCARAVHHDANTLNTKTCGQRWYEASRSAARLFRRYPEMSSAMPMFDDKGPIRWTAETPGRIARKILRTVISGKPSVIAMESVLDVVAEDSPIAWIRSPLSRWIVGAYIYQGYRRGLKETD